MPARTTRAAAISVTAALALSLLAATPASAATTTVSGTVTTSTGAPIEGVTVSFVGALTPDQVADSEDITEADGRFSFAVSPGSFHLEFRHTREDDDDFVSRWAPDAYPGGIGVLDETTVTDGQTLEVTQVLQPSSTISGTVTDSTGKARENAIVRATGTAVRVAPPFEFDITTKSGRYSISGLPADTYRLEIVDPPLATRIIEGVVVGAGESRTGVNAKLVKSGGATGRTFIDGKKPFSSNDPILTVRDANGVKIRRVHASGKFSAGHLAPGKYTLEFQPLARDGEWFARKVVPITVKAGKRITGLRVNLRTTPEKLTEPIATSVKTTIEKRHVAKGKALSITVKVRSYGEVNGGRLTMKLPGAKLQSTKVTADGTATFRVSTKKTKRGKHHVVVKFAGTSSAEADSTRSGVRVR